MMSGLPENAEIEIIDRGTLTFVIIYTKNLFSKVKNVFHPNLRLLSVFTQIGRI